MRAVILLTVLLSLAAPAQAGPRAEVLPGPLSGEVTGVLDGDTVTVRLRVWLGQTVETSVRIDGIDAPEMRGRCADESRRARAARAALLGLLGDGRVVLSDIRLEKYAGRVLARAATADGRDVGRYMLDHGHARAYGGRARGGWCG